ncbi:Eco57I restriction-modification methylase domain-containing protein [Thermoflexibacter ruber]|uniref:site-specific DNA-methyltransferase (adenine-specific) n=1 Tax=Thermoflexibacter ruber TaxID=1003 RepID=A0A1I2J1F1_9BACT|nr:DNA methyltransferase [Thermoflexibacter ruber]SFF48279.1 Type I restriction enzyme R protein N terminus (HSDR_N) [Thermoflexibacter ruber]
MSLFQKTVLKEFVKAQNQVLVQEAYEKFQAHFGDPTIQQNIKEAKEEQYQEGFLKDLFVGILGYTLFPHEKHNLITEYKNPNDAKKVDAVIVLNEKILAVIELKDTKTIDLKNIELQAFAYKNAHQNCRYVITSNFQKLRFYLDNTLEHEEFDLFNLDLERFKVLYTLLHQRNIAKDLPLDLKQKSIQREQEITLAFYNDYEAFRESLFKNIVHLNRGYDKLLLFQKTQKLLDRIVFMCFAEDKGLLPANLIHTIIKEWETRKEEGDKISLYDRFKAHFGFINDGFRSKKYDIYGYNGGLFAYDEVLDNLRIDDENLRSRSEQLSSYDFDTDIDVNVLGHIFEHSLNELEAKKAELLEDIADEEAGREVKQRSKRKVDGIFYTPLYITNYIIEETLGKLCTEKKKELQLDFVVIDFEKEENRKLILENLQAYQTWLSQVRVLDPACGSGAFLNQVLNYFLKEYTWIENTKKSIPKTEAPKEEKPKQENAFFTPFALPEKKTSEQDFSHQILENNIFGVDINFESVSITKLSLWLRIAQGKRKLNDLSENIKQGNSLIDDPSIDERAFDWKKEFPKAFVNLSGFEGFDLIVGNPPYVRQELLSEAHKKYYEKRYSSVYSGVADLYVYFYAKGLELLKEGGTLGFITPNKWFKTKYGEGLRKILKNLEIEQIVDFFEERVFEDASTEPQIIILKKKLSDNNFYYFAITQVLLEEKEITDFDKKLDNPLIVEKKNFTDTEWIFATGEKQAIFDKISGRNIPFETKPLYEYVNFNIYRGIVTGFNKAFIIDRKTKEQLIKKDARSAELIKPYMMPTDIKKWHLENKNEWFLINTGYNIEISENTYPAIFKYLKKFEKELVARQDKGKTPYNLRACDYYEEFDKPKIIYIYTAVNHYFYYDTEGYYLNNSAYFITNADLFLCAFLNSKVFDFYKRLKFVAYGNAEERGRNKLDYNKMVQVPIPILSLEQKQPFEHKVLELQKLNKGLDNLSQKFLKIIQAEFKPEKINGSLGKWYLLTWEKFQDEIKKQKGQISPKQRFEWIEIFEEKQKEAVSIDTKIQQLEKEIDNLVYKLYDLTEEEIKIVENG